MIQSMEPKNVENKKPMINSTRERILKSYRKKLSAALPCSNAEKERIISDVEQRIRDYFENHPAATDSEISKQFGTPEEIADKYFQSLQGNELKKRFTTKRIIYAAVFVVAFALAIVVGVFYLMPQSESVGKAYPASGTVAEERLADGMTSSGAGASAAL